MTLQCVHEIYITRAIRVPIHLYINYSKWLLDMRIKKSKLHN